MFIFNLFEKSTKHSLNCQTVLLARRHLNTMILNNFEYFSSISNIFQETHNFLVLTDPLIICVYLRTINRDFRNQGNVRHPTSKLLKYDLVQTLNTFRNPFLRIFAAGKAPIVVVSKGFCFHHWGDFFFHF